jgi:hypothetical protein
MKVYITKKQLNKIISEQISYDDALLSSKDIDIEVINHLENGVMLSLSLPSGKPHEKVSDDADGSKPESWTYFPITIVINVDFLLEPVGKNHTYCKWIVGDNVSVNGDNIPEEWVTYLSGIVRNASTPSKLIDELMSVNHDKSKSEKIRTIHKLNGILDSNIPKGKIDVNKI